MLSTKNNKLAALIFDFDGVIIESVGIKDKAFHKIFARYPNAFAAAWDFQMKNSGLSRVAKFENLLKLLPASEKQNLSVASLCEEFSQVVLDNVIGCPYVEDAVAILKHFHAKLPVFLASITPQKELDLIVEKRGLSPYFTKVYGSTGKKDEIINTLLTEYGYKPLETLLIGDTMQDLTAAKTTNIGFIGRLNQHSFPENTICFGSLSDIKQHIETHYFIA